MSDFGRGFGIALAIMGTGIAAGSAVVVGGIGYAANKLYFEPTARASEFNARASDALAQRNLRVISSQEFTKGGAGCAAPLYGATFIARNAQNAVVEGAVCMSRRTEATVRFNI